MRSILCGLLLALHVISVLSCAGNISLSEYEALHALFDSLNGSNWKWDSRDPEDTKWIFPSPLSDPCSIPWQGVACGDSEQLFAQCSVNTLTLFDFNLDGTLPTQIGLLAAMEDFELSSNFIYGTIPTELGMMTSMVSLSLEINYLTGQVPTEIALLVTVHGIDLSSNSLSKTIPSELGSLRFLEQLYLDENSFTGNIPTYLAQLTKLTFFDVSVNMLSGSISSEFGSLSTVQDFYVDENRLTGQLPSELGLLSKAEYIVLNTNNFTGTIPSEFGGLVSAYKIFLSENQLTGSIPSELFGFTGLVFFTVAINSLEGVIPTELGGLTNLQYLYLYDNSFTGSIPTSIGQLKELEQLFVELNSFSGPLPTEMFSLTALSEFSVHDNIMNGPLPSQIGQLASILDEADFSSNMFTGTVPSELGLLSLMTEVYLSENYLSNSLPTELYALPSITSFEVDGNVFSGTLSSELGLMTSITLLWMYSNLFSKSIPSELGELRLAEAIFLEGNELTGSIPTEIGKLNVLLELLVSNNHLSGFIPTELGLIPHLQVLRLDGNHLSGTIPTELGLLHGLQLLTMSSNSLESSIPSQVIEGLVRNSFLYLFDNLLTGAIPTVISEMTNLISICVNTNFLEGSVSDLSSSVVLQTFEANGNQLSGPLPMFSVRLEGIDLSGNLFTGTIGESFINSTSRIESIDLSACLLSGTVPAYFQDMARMQSLNLSNNQFSGPIDSCSFAGSNSTLEAIDLSSNLFTGTIPASIFQSSELTTVLLYGNCFSGSLPAGDVMCTSSLLQNLYLAALTGGCGSIIPHSLSPIFKGSSVKRVMSGSIPSCVWSLSSLEVLQLSGNGFTGTIGDIDSNAGQFRALLLSSNQFTGTIPASLQTYGQFTELDLSGNRLSGTLSSDFVVSSNTTVLDLTVNRLSGFLPQSFLTAPVLDVLSGNLFQCKKSTVPPQDPNSEDYVCGSSNLDLSLAVAVVLFVLAGCLLLFVTCRNTWVSSALTVAHPPILSVLRHETSWLARTMAAFLCLPMVWYVLLKMVPSFQKFSTHSVQYMWTPTVAFLHGWAPTFEVLLTMTASLLCMWVTDSSNLMEGDGIQGAKARALSGEDDCDAASRRSSKANTSTLLIIGAWFSIACAHVVNALVVITINGLYVAAALNGLISVYLLLLIQFCLGTFKVIWNSLAMPWLVNLAVGKANETALAHKTFMCLFSFVGGPFFSTFLASSDCFENVFTGLPSVVSNSDVEVYSCYNSCVEVCTDDTCTQDCSSQCSLNTEQLSVTTSPPWVYSYQCSSSIVVDYVPVLVLSFAVSGAIIPIFVLLSYLLSTENRRRLLWYVPESLLTAVFIDPMDACDDKSGINAPINEQQQPIVLKQLLNVGSLRMKYLLNVTVMLTFGLASPLLAAIIALESLIQCTLVHVLVGRCAEQEKSNLQSRLALESTDASSSSKHALENLIVSLYVGTYWCLFVFDMVGDVYGNLAGGLSMLVPFLLPLMLWALREQIVIVWKRLVGLCCICLSVGDGRVTEPRPSIGPAVFHPQHAGSEFGTGDYAGEF